MSHNINLDDLSMAQLKALQEDSAAKAKSMEKDDRKRVIGLLRQLAKDEGYDLDELMGAGKAKKKASDKLPPKYKDPDTGKTWSGKGPTPQWLKPYKEQGSIDEVKV
jgi:DNA-binding protein H-NS